MSVSSSAQAAGLHAAGSTEEQITGTHTAQASHSHHPPSGDLSLLPFSMRSLISSHVNSFKFQLSILSNLQEFLDFDE